MNHGELKRKLKKSAVINFVKENAMKYGTVRLPEKSFLSDGMTVMKYRPEL